MTTRMSAITDWRTPNEDLPDVLPGEEYEYVITPQKHVTLCRILVHDLHPVHDLRLVRLQIGAVEISFKLERTDGPRRAYQPPKRRTDLAAEIPLLAGQDVRLTLRNHGDVSAKPRAALLVREGVA